MKAKYKIMQGNICVGVTNFYNEISAGVIEDDTGKTWYTVTVEQVK